MSREAFLPLFFGDFLAATSEWEGEEGSLYLTLLGHQWSLGSLPADPAKLCRLVRWDRKLFDRCWQQVSEKFTEGDGRLYNMRLEEHRNNARKIAEKNSESGRIGAQRRWGKDGKRHSERHQSANGESMAGATDALWRGDSDPTKTPMARRISIHTKPNKNEEVGAFQGEELRTSEGEEGSDSEVSRHE